TRHGPLIEVDEASHQGFALAWTGFKPDDRTSLALVELNRAADAGQVRAALHDFETPVQNAVYADDHGDIGYIRAGRIPIIAHVVDQSEMPEPGDRLDNEWIGTIPFDELPQAVNPGEGYLASANNRTMAPGYPHFIAAKFDYDYRIQRIRELLGPSAPR